MSAPINQWPESQICQGCSHGYKREDTWGVVCTKGVELNPLAPVCIKREEEEEDDG